MKKQLYNKLSQYENFQTLPQTETQTSTQSSRQITDKIQLLIESRSRDVMTYPNPYDFTLNYSTLLTDKEKISNYINPISDGYPYHQWQWNSDLGITIINGGRGYYNEDGTHSLTGVTNPVPTIVQKGTEYNNGIYNVSTTGTTGFGCTLNVKFKGHQVETINKVISSGSNYKIGEILH